MEHYVELFAMDESFRHHDLRFVDFFVNCDVADLFNLLLHNM